MLDVRIPGYKTLPLEHLVLDYNGTLACDGALLDGVGERLHRLSVPLKIHVLTADTFGTAQAALAGLPCTLRILPNEGQAVGKRDYVAALNAARTVCIGNGRNDRLMLETTALGILVVQTEGAAVEALTAADVVTRNILDALDLLVQPQRLAATLRS